MSVQNPSEWKVTSHARVQIKKRFGLIDNDIPQWIIRFLNNCQYVCDQDNGRVKQKMGDIVAILDIKNKNVITMFNESDDSIKIPKSQRNPEIQSALKDSMSAFIQHKRKKLAEDIKIPDKFLRDAMREFKKKPNEETVDALRLAFDDVLKLFEKFDSIQKETDNLLKG